MDAHDLELELEGILLSPEWSKSETLKPFNQLLQEHPEIFQLALNKNPPEGLLPIFLERILEYSLMYQHPVYQPYFPKNAKDFELATLFIQKFLPHLETPLTKALSRLSQINLAGISQIVKNKEAVQTAMFPQIQPVQEAPQSPAPLETQAPWVGKEEFRTFDPGLNEGTLQEFWAQKKNDPPKWPGGFLARFPPWAIGIIKSMNMTYGLYTYLENQAKKIRNPKTNNRLEPWYRMLHILIGIDYFWQFNRLCTSVPADLSIQASKQAFLEHIYSIHDFFMQQLPDLHPLRNVPKTWQFERLRGTNQAQKVQCRYTYEKAEVLVEATATILAIKEHNYAEAEASASAPIVIEKQAISEANLKIVEQKDPGLREEILWALYLNQKKDALWPDDFCADWPGWSKGIINAMKASYTLYNDFQGSRNRIKECAGFKIMPHHKVINLLIAAEYFWIFNSRDVALPEELELLEQKDLFQNHIYGISDCFVKLLPEKHPYVLREDLGLLRRNWTAERIRGTSRSPKVIMRYTDPEITLIAEVASGSLTFKIHN